LFALLNDRNTTSRLVRRILAAAYSPEGFAGDEDNGEMGSWYVLSALGLFAAAPGVSSDYVLSSVPLFRRVHLRALDVFIEAPAAAQDSPLVSEVLWQSHLVKAATVSYAALSSGGTLRFQAPGDSKAGKVVSSLRGAWRGAVKKARSAVKRVRDPQSSHSEQQTQEEDLGLPPTSDEGQFSAITLLALAASAVFCLLFVKRVVGPQLFGAAVKPD